MAKGYETGRQYAYEIPVPQADIGLCIDVESEIESDATPTNSVPRKSDQVADEQAVCRDEGPDIRLSKTHGDRDG